jgi:ABC-type transport system substrate-binding protein
MTSTSFSMHGLLHSTLSRRRFVLGSVLTGSTWLMAACSPAPTATAPTTLPALQPTAAPTAAPATPKPTSPSASAPTSAAAPQPTTPAAASTPGSSLIFARQAEGDALDPATSGSGYSYETLLHVLDNLVTFKALSAAELAQGARLGDVEPALATSWTTSDDGLTWTFALRQGVKFHDGTALDADAVITNIDRQVNPSSPYFFQGRMINGTFLYGALDSYRAVTPSTVELKLKRPFGPFLNNLAMPAAGILSPAALKQYGQDIAKNPVGSGAFKFVEWKPQDHITLQRNPEWWGSPVALDQIIYRVIPDAAVERASLEKGEVDFIDTVVPDDAAAIKQNAALTLYQVPGSINGVHLRGDQKPHDDVRVRQALNYAINKEEINQQLYSGLAAVANSPLPPIVREYDASIQPYAYDLDKARQLLRDAGYPDGFEVRMVTYNVTTNGNGVTGQKLAEAIQGYLSQINVRTNIETLDLGGWRQKKLAGDYNLCVGGWSGLNADADGFFYALYHSDNFGKNNTCWIRDPKLDQMIIDGQQEYDAAKRTQIYSDLQKYIMQLAPWIYINVPDWLIAGKKTVTDVRFAGLLYDRSLKQTRIQT